MLPVLSHLHLPSLLSNSKFYMKWKKKKKKKKQQQQQQQQRKLHTQIKRQMREKRK